MFLNSKSVAVRFCGPWVATQLHRWYATVVALLGVVMIMVSPTAISFGTDGLPLSTTPDAGDHEIRILSPSVIQLRALNVVDSEGELTSTRWNFSADRSPDISDLQVLVNGQPIPVAELSVTRRVAHAELKIDRMLALESINLRLSSPVPADASLEVLDTTGRWFTDTMRFSTTASADRVAGSVHVSHAGFEPDGAKFAQVGAWLGDLGELDMPEGTPWRLVEFDTRFFGRATRGFLSHRGRRVWLVVPL